jgi:predicted ABC-type transport system involved in lysophospholipase L1 biosynthesis ATPase subunit
VSLLAFEGVEKRFADGDQEIVVLRGASFELDEGDLLGVRGSRGSGKSTLLRLAAGLEAPSRGTVRFAGRDLAALGMDDRARLWREQLAFVFFDEEPPPRRARVVERVALALLSTGCAGREAQMRARRALERTGVLACADAWWGDLSQEDLLRVELAGALVREPMLLLIDEPPVLRSPSRRLAFYQLLWSLRDEPGLTVVLASEDLELVQGTRRVMSIGGGRVRVMDSPGAVVPFPGARAVGRSVL